MSRLPSLLAGTATIPLVFLVGDRTVGRRAALVAAALVALSPFMTYYSAEARGYQVMIFCALVSTLALLFLAEGRSRRWWVVYALAAASAMYTHYTAAFWLLAAFGWLVWARPDLRRDALIANVGAAILFAPWISGVLADFNSPTTKILSELEPFTLDFVSTALAHWAIGFPYSVLGLDQLPGTLGLVLIVSRAGHGRRGPLAAVPRRAAAAGSAPRPRCRARAGGAARRGALQRGLNRPPRHAEPRGLLAGPRAARRGVCHRGTPPALDRADGARCSPRSRSPP